MQKQKTTITLAYRFGVWEGNQNRIDQKRLNEPDYAQGVEEGLRLADLGLWVERPSDNPDSYCPTCGRPSGKAGFTQWGKQRWRCYSCNKRWTGNS